MSLFTLLNIGKGVVVLPFLDEDESKKLHVSKEISFIVQSFPFQYMNNVMLDDHLWRHGGTTYYRYNIHGGIYDLSFNFVGQYNPLIDDIVVSPMPSFVIELTDQEERVVEHTVKPFANSNDGFINHLTIDGITYLVKDDHSLWLQDVHMVGPFFCLAKDRSMVACTYTWSDRRYYNRQQRYLNERSPTEIYLFYRYQENRQKELDSRGIYTYEEMVRYNKFERIPRRLLSDYPLLRAEIIERLSHDAETFNQFLLEHGGNYGINTLKIYIGIITQFLQTSNSYHIRKIMERISDLYPTQWDL